MIPFAVRRFVRRVGSILQRNDLPTLLRKSTDACLRGLFRTSVNRLICLDAATAGTPAPNPDFAFRFLTAEEVERFATDPVYHLDPKLAERIRGGNNYCYAALAGERLAAFGWMALESIEAEHVDGIPVTFPSDTAYKYFGFTHPEFRGARLHGQITRRVLHEFGARGVTKIFALVSWLNVASLKSCRRSGFRDLGPMIAIGRHVLSRSVARRVARDEGIRFGGF